MLTLYALITLCFLSIISIFIRISHKGKSHLAPLVNGPENQYFNDGSHFMSIKAQLHIAPAVRVSFLVVKNANTVVARIYLGGRH